ncbi:diguanylate cyclase (GGDEF)-like protein [Mycolicibacterium sp. BK556]|uniref:GGDEF domain-containing protein n=1 Tax=unclassified Mycolicibacterium TaxID=2636767 RepID=UPI00160AEB04|nr:MULTISPECIES: GGDEF domain-containing protein [unclassified Mycolicibacterium]MBB3604606.1 diguanylate cyclase (GGDEF)-like protein [Mycolicibacterium sp. BK556]MBB3634681.1 diguanylate cyclase (GGDEF)-like protein [Mycolicibacterium sp. BK607]
MGRGGQVHSIGLWWRQPDHYDWLSSYLKARHLQPFMRGLMFAVLLTIAAAIALALASPSGPQTPAQRIVTCLAGAVLAGTALWYLCRWPTRIQSQVFSISGNACVAAGVLAESDPRTAMIGAVAFVGLAGYVAFFHTAPLLVLTLGTGVATAAVSAVRIAMTGDTAMAVAKLLILCGGMLAVPFCGQVLVHWLSIDAVKSSTDTLTGLPNRRGFFRSARTLLRQADYRSRPYFTVAMIDLDGFKRLNDTLGHPTGDAVLVAVADSLRHASGSDTAIARAGGEEFLFAQLATLDDARERTEELRRAIAALPWGVTASLGLASTVIRAPALKPLELIEWLIARADAAMYDAKRSGGNQIRYAGDLTGDGA